MIHKQICKKIKNSSGWKLTLTLLKTKEGKLLTWEMFYSRMFPKQFYEFKKGSKMFKKIAIIILLILVFGCNNSTEPQNKNFFTTGVQSIQKGQTITIAKIEDKYLQIKYLGYNNQYAIINYTGLEIGALDNIAAFIYDLIKYPFVIDLLMNIYSIKIEVLLITSDKFYFRVKEYHLGNYNEKNN